MKTKNLQRVSTVENHRYTIPADQVAQHIQNIVPERAIVHYWYEVPEKQSNKTKTSNPEQNITNPQLKSFLADMEKSGGLFPEDVEAMKNHSKEFRANFDL